MKGLDWSNERYVRAYISDVAAWNLLGFQAQALYLMLLRKLDISGVLSLSGLPPEEAVCSYFPDAKPRAIARSLEKLLKRKDMDNVTFEIQEVDEIPIDPKTGKFRLILLPENQAA